MSPDKPPDDRARIGHIIDAVREAIVFAHDQTLETLEADRMRALAVTRLVEIIGEAASTVTPEFKAAHPNIPWRIMAGMRNHLIHAYFKVDLRVVLDTAQSDLPPLISALETVVAEEGWDAEAETR